MTQIHQIAPDRPTELFSIEAEQQVLGAAMTNNDLAAKVPWLRDDHFCDPVHAALWRNITGRIAKGHVASPVTLKADFVGHEGLGELGGVTYLVRLAGAAVSSYAIAEYGLMLVEMAERRKLAAALDSARSGLGQGWDAAKAAAAVELALHEREEAVTEPRAVSFLKAQTHAIERMVEIQQGANPGAPTGLPSLDAALTLAPGRYTILGGATSMGKSALAMWIAYAAATRGHGVGFVSLEMPEGDLANRINSIVSQIPYKAYDRQMSETLMRKVIESARELESLPLQIFRDSVRDVPSIMSEASRLKRLWQPNDRFHGLKVLVIDYLQLVRGKGESAFVRLSQVANDLKQVAKMLDVHVIALAQVGRDLGKMSHWTESRPRLADLRGSGDLENAPDNVIFAFRPEYYLERMAAPKKLDEMADREAEMARWKGKMEIIIGKARMGEIGSVTVGCDMATNRFFELDEQKEIEF
jgi:replicative DNA helicase